MSNFVHALGIVVFMCFLCACSTDNPSSPSTGALFGQVQLTDEYGDKQTDHSGVVIRVLSSGGTWYVTTSDANGDWRINNIPAEVYEVFASHVDYDSTMHTRYQPHQNIAHPGAGALRVMSFSLAKTPAMDLVRVIDSQGRYQIDSTWDGHGYFMYYATYVFTATIESKVDRPLLNLSYDVIGTAKPDATCDERIDSPNLKMERVGNRLNITLRGQQQHIGKSNTRPMDGTTRFIQFRRYYSQYDSAAHKNVSVCTTPFVLPYTY